MNLFVLKVLRRLKLADSLKLVGNRQLGEASFQFPIYNRLGWQHTFDAEPWMTTLLGTLKSFFEQCPERVFADVGANVGQTLVKFRSAQPECAYVGFEPNATCMAYIDELVALNGWNNVELYPIAIGKQAELCTLNFFHDSTVDSTASIVADFRPDEPVRRTSHIAVFPMVMVGMKKPMSFLKIDVEGAEFEVLSGAEGLIGDDRPLVCMEILPCYEAANEFRLQRQRKIESLMGALDYHCFRVAKTANSDFAGLESVNAIGVHSDLSSSDYLWIPAEKVDMVRVLVAATLAGPQKA